MTYFHMKSSKSIIRNLSYLRLVKVAQYSLVVITASGVVGFFSAAFLGSLEMFTIFMAGTMLGAILVTLCATFRDSIHSRIEDDKAAEERLVSRNFMRQLNH